MYQKNITFLKRLVPILVAMIILLNGIGLSYGGQASAAIAYVTQNFAVSSALVSTQSITTPSGMAANDLEVAQVSAYYKHPGSLTITAPSGWTAVAGMQNSGYYNQQTFYHLVTTSEPASYTFSFSNTIYVVIAIGVYSGESTKTPIDNQGQQTDASSTTQSALSISTSFNGDMIMPVITYDGSATASSYSGLSKISSNANNLVGNFAGYVIDPTTGASNSYATTTTTAIASLAQTIAIAPTGVAAGIQFIGSSTPTTCYSCTSLSISAPTGWQGGDMLITSVEWYQNTSTLSVPAGWSVLGTAVTQGSYTVEDFYRISQSTDASSYTWSFSSSVEGIVAESDYSGIDSASPFDGTAEAVDAAGTSHTLPSLTTNYPDDMQIGVWAYNVATTTSAFPTGMAQDWNVDDNCGAHCPQPNIGSSAAHITLSSAGAIPTETATSGATANALMQSIALRANLPIPQLIAPATGTTDLLLEPTFQLVSASINNSPLEYKIQICSDSACSAIVDTYDETKSQVGWSGQDANSGTAYIGSSLISNSTIATYKPTSPLNPGTQYWWRGFSYDTSNSTFGISSNISTFTTSYAPAAPTLISPANAATNIPSLAEFQLAATDKDGDALEYQIQLCADSACATILSTYDETLTQTGWNGQDSNNFTAFAADQSNYINSTPAFYDILKTTAQLVPATTYYWRAYAINPTGSNVWGPASVIDSFTINKSETRILNGVIMQGKII